MVRANFTIGRGGGILNLSVDLGVLWSMWQQNTDECAHVLCVVDACVVFMAAWFAQCTYVCLGVVVDARVVCMDVANAHVV